MTESLMPIADRRQVEAAARGNQRCAVCDEPVHVDPRTCKGLTHPETTEMREKRLSRAPKKQKGMFAPRRVDSFTEMGGFKVGDLVTIQGEVKSKYNVHGFKRNQRTGNEWADLYGGHEGKESFRAVSISRLVSLDKGQRRV